MQNKIINSLVNLRRLAYGMIALGFAYALSFFIYPTLLPNRTKATSGVISVPTLEISPSSTASLSVTPGTFSSTTQTLSVKTSNYTGYTLNITAGSSADLVKNDNPQKTIPTISLGGAQYLTPSQITSGYGYNIGNNGRYLPMPTGSGTDIDVTSGPNPTTANTYTLAFGANVASTVPAGTYEKELTITAVANDTGYVITYDDNVADSSVSNMPTPNPNSSTVSGTSVVLSSTLPTRSGGGYTFLGWDTNSAATSATYTAANLSAGTATLTLDPETGNSVTLYAIWSRTYSLTYDLNANDATGGPSADSGSSTTGSYTFTVSSTEPARDNYNFLGWSESDSATTATYTGGDSYTVTTTPKTLYAVWETAATPTMDNFQCSSLSSGATTTLADPRDGTEYTIAKLGDNKCWMTQNLKLNLANLTEPISSSNTNNPTADFVTAAAASPASSSSWCTTNSSACDDQILYNTTNLGGTSCGTSDGNCDAYGTYYNWYTATGGNGKYSTGTGVTATGDICPSGWHLPTGNSSGEFYALNTAINSGSTSSPSGLVGSPANFVYSGYYYGSSAGSRGSSGGEGVYWSSTVSTGNSNGAYDLLFSESLEYVHPGTGYVSKYFGFAVRCVAGTNFALEFDANNGSNAPDTQYVNVASGTSSVTFNITTDEPTRDGYMFLGWATSAGATTAAYQPGGTYTTSSTTNKLYAVWKSGTKMQDWQGCSTLATGATTTLVDIRDYTSYTVAKLNDDKCWMTQNMRFDFSAYGDKLNASNTHNPTSAFVTSANAKPAHSTSGFTSSNYNVLKYNKSNIGGTDCSGSGACDAYGIYYNWFTATAGNGQQSTTGTVSGDICPHGWHLPTGNTGGEFYVLNTKQNSGSTSSPSGLVGSPANFVYSGYYYNSSANYRGSSSGNGYYWSSTVYASNSSNAYILYFYSSSVGPGTLYGNKYCGLAVRCVADS